MRTKKRVVNGMAVAVVAGMVLAGTAVETANAAPIAGGDVIKLDAGTVGDGDGVKAADWNTLTGVGTITAGSVKRHGDGAIVDNVTIAVAASANPGQNNDSRCKGWSGLGADPYYNSESYTDLIYAWGLAVNSLTTTFGGLNAGLKYNVRLYSLINESLANINVSVTDGAGTVDRTGLNRITLYNTAPLSPDLIFSGVSPNGSGNIVITITSSAGLSFQAAVLETEDGPPAGTVILFR